MALYWGVEAAPRVDHSADLEQMLGQADECLIAGGFAARGDRVVVVSGAATRTGATNRMIVHTVGEARRQIRW
jgi:pyruvate kinase